MKQLSHIHYAHRTQSYTTGYGHREVQVCHCSAARSKTVVTPGFPTIRSDSEWSAWSEPLESLRCG